MSNPSNYPWDAPENDPWNQGTYRTGSTRPPKSHGGIIAVLLAVSLLIISNTVKLAMYDRREEIGIMKMVGATNGFIRLPFIVEGFTLGMLGAAMAFGLEWVMYDTMVLKIGEVDALQLFKFVPFQELLIPMVITFAAAGMFVGLVGSGASIRRFMDV